LDSSTLFDITISAFLAKTKIGKNSIKIKARSGLFDKKLSAFYFDT